MMGFVKLACAFTAMAFPFLAGLLYPAATSDEVRIVLVSGGVFLGLAGVFGFAAIEQREG
ncbi:hypothetical protein [Bosea sp. (in: a-proteobacteria)]|jgi:hypothetical protein|uniref:hypothetical protein n=1 Tax=Bosea sp. (in: a-proteobacteria) TaxID=1871050 RepID=UPI0035695EBC